MPKPFNIQDQYLNQLRKDRATVEIRYLCGAHVSGCIKSFDMFCILLDCGDQGDILVYKHNIGSISVLHKEFHLFAPNH